LLPLAPQVSQVGNAALIEREAVTLPLDHAFGFELGDVGCNRDAAPMPTRWRSRAFWIAVERQAWRGPDDRGQSS
jgi:hypothetical protein